MNLLKKYKSRIGSWLIFSFIIQTASPLIAATQLQTDVMPNQENLIIDATVNSIITRMVEAATQAGVEAELSAGAKKCYKRIAEGQEALPTLAVWDAMPNMLNFAVESVRAARPTAAPSAVVGQGNCEVTQLLAIIKSIQNSIGSLCNSACNNTILGILGNARDILGVNISCALEDLVFSDSLILERLEELEATLTECCDGLRTEIEELDIQIAECCEAVIEDILDGREEILDKISTLTGEIKCCDCDFFITQVATGEPDNHPVGTPITVSGIYCLAESVTGTIDIQTSNVTILFRDHTLTPDLGTGYGIRVDGDVSAPLNNIRIEGGTIQGGTTAQAPLHIQNCMGVQIIDMSFVLNVGNNIELINVDNFVIQNCQFVQGTQFAMTLISCTNGAVTKCTVRDFAFPDGGINYIVLANCRQILAEDIVVTNNTAQSMPAVFLNSTNNSTLRNIRITNNSAVIEFRGIDCINSSQNTIEQCYINNNQMATLPGEVGAFSGIRIRGLTALNANNNIIRNSHVNDNSIAPGIGGFGFLNNDTSKKVTRALAEANVLTGIDIGEESQTNSCQNTLIENCSVNGNSNIGDVDSGFNLTAVIVGVNVGSILGTRSSSVGENVGANTIIRNCTVDNNTASTHFVGVNLASILLGSSNPVLGANTCQSSVIENCTANNNAIAINGAALVGWFFVGFSLGNILGAEDTATIGDYCATSCSIRGCSTNNNTIGTSSSSIHFAGILLASTVISVSAAIGQNVSSNCSINDCTVNNNTSECGGIFNGIGIGGSLFVSDATIGTNAGSNCTVNNCSVDANALIGNAIVTFRFLGISFASLFAGASHTNTVQAGACARSSVHNCTVNNNSIRNGFYGGINLASTYFPATVTAITIGAGVCDNCNVDGCAINDNIHNHVNGVAPFSFSGINVGTNNRLGPAGGGEVSNGSCNNCVIAQSSISNNQFLVTPAGAPDSFFGVGFGRTADDMPRSGNSCNNCVLENVRVCSNIFRADSASAVMRGFSFGSLNTPSASICNNITATSCVVESNDYAANAGPGTGSFAGFFATGADASPLATGICNNLTLVLCEVNSNIAPTGSYGYNLLATPSLAYINNALLQGCVAKQNLTSIGFNFSDLRYLTVDGCTSNQNIHGFVFNGGSGAVVQNCIGIGSDDQVAGGTAFMINSLVDAVFLNNKAFKNVWGFDAGGGIASICLMRDNVAQNNTTGFRSSPLENDRHLHNFAQGNGTNYSLVNAGLIVDIAGLQTATPNPFANVST